MTVVPVAVRLHVQDFAILLHRVSAFGAIASQYCTSCSVWKDRRMLRGSGIQQALNHDCWPHVTSVSRALNEEIVVWIETWICILTFDLSLSTTDCSLG